MLIIAGALLVLALGILGGILLTRDSGGTSDDGVPQTVNATHTLTTTTVTTTENGVETIITTSVPTRDDDWGGGSGYTVFLASMRRYSGARAKQSAAEAAGLSAGVLKTSDYSSLTPGYWGVFSGRFDSKAAAADRVSEARAAGFSDAYARLVSP